MRMIFQAKFVGLLNLLQEGPVENIIYNPTVLDVFTNFVKQRVRSQVKPGTQTKL